MNPLKKEVKGISKGKNREEVEKSTGFVHTELVGMNKAIDIIAVACSSCWDKKIPDDWAGRAEYVARRTRTGHTSILEHSNFVVYINVPEAFMDDMVRFLSWIKYLNKNVYRNSKGEWCILLGGSYRGFSDLYLQCDDLNNAVLKSVTKCLYDYAPSAVFEDVCKAGLMDINMFINAEPDPENFKYLSCSFDGDTNFDDFEIIGIDDIKILRNNIWNIDKEFCTSLSNIDLIKYVTVSVLFKNMSRIITQQLCRHRNAITQESQRYVDYSKACFNSPAKFKDRYDSSHKYTVKFGSKEFHMDLQELGESICNIYGMLQDPVDGKEFALLKEDARAYLPGNTQCRKIYMTFTYATLFKFLHLREASGAQAEIRQYAVRIGDWIRSHTKFSTKEIMDTYIKAKLLIDRDPFYGTDEWWIEDTDGDTTTRSEVSEDDYLNYLNKVEADVNSANNDVTE